MNEPFKVLYEDNHLIVAVKAPGVLSQADHTGDMDMLTLLKDYVKRKYHKPADVYLGLVHRLDRPVGGLMVFARTSKAAARLSAQLREHRMGREYLLVCQGVLHEPFTLTDHVVKDESRNLVSVVDAQTPGAQRAVLHGTPVAVKDGRTLVKVRLETGRGHQIRVQMAHFGHPLIGDRRYGGVSQGDIALYGWRLTLTHPTLQTPMVFEHMPAGGAFEGFEETSLIGGDND